MSPQEDHLVDRPEVDVRISKGMQLTGTNRTIDLTTFFSVFRECFIAKDPGPKPCSLNTSLPGDYSGGVTPVLIPNTAVKPSSGDDTLHGENSTLPGFFICPVCLMQAGLFHGHGYRGLFSP